MNCSVHMFYKMIFSNKFGFILETSLFLYTVYTTKASKCDAHSWRVTYNLDKKPLVSNTIAFCTRLLITSVKRFAEQAPVSALWHKYQFKLSSFVFLYCNNSKKFYEAYQFQLSKILRKLESTSDYIKWTIIIENGNGTS